MKSNESTNNDESVSLIIANFLRELEPLIKDEILDEFYVSFEYLNKKYYLKLIPNRILPKWKCFILRLINIK
jgi:hypothetical protein